MRTFKANRTKVKNGLIFFLTYSPNATRTQIMKFFFFVDFSLYQKRQRPAFGGVYVHMQHGPVPIEVKNKYLPELLKQNIIKENKKQDHKYSSYRYSICKDSDYDESVFEAEELDTMFKVVSYLKRLKTALNAIRSTHKLELWKYTKNGDTIPYEFLIMNKEQIKDYMEKVRHYKALARKDPPLVVDEKAWKDYDMEPAVSLQKLAAEIIEKYD